MYNDQVDRYATEVGGVRDELRTFIAHADKGLAEDMLLRPGGLKDFTSPDPDILKRATVMLGKAPGQIRQTVQSLRNKDPEKLVRIMITAVALADMASQAIRKEREFEYVVGRGYREAARYVAESLKNRTDDLSKSIETALERAISWDLVNRAKSAAASGRTLAGRPRADEGEDLVERIRKALDFQLSHAQSSCRQVLQPDSGYNDSDKKFYQKLMEASKRAVEDFEELSNKIDLENRHKHDLPDILG
jgi:hypothetical protein